MDPNVKILFEFLGLFKDISLSDREIISSKLKIRNVKEGEVLVKEGDVAKELFFITKGILKIITVNEKGNLVVLFFIKENQFCTILNSFNKNIPSTESIIAACDTNLVAFSKENLLHLYDAIPEFKNLINGITQQALIDKINLRNNYMGEDASTRYQRFILRQPDIALRVSLSDVASYLGITQQSLSRIRKNAR